MMAWRGMAAAGLMLAWAAPAQAAPSFAKHPTPAAVAASLTRYGAHRTVNALFEQHRWDAVSDRIGAGEAAWVALAPKLAPGTDAGTAEDLPIALAFALPRNPSAVLAALTTGAFDVGEVCGAPFIEGTVADVPAYRRRAIAAVGRVDSPPLAATKAACLKALSEAS